MNNKDVAKNVIIEIGEECKKIITNAEGWNKKKSEWNKGYYAGWYSAAELILSHIERRNKDLRISL